MGLEVAYLPLYKSFAGKVVGQWHESGNGAALLTWVTTLSQTPTVDTLIFPVLISCLVGGAAAAKLVGVLEIGGTRVFRADFPPNQKGPLPLNPPFGCLCRAGQTWKIIIYSDTVDEGLEWFLQTVVG